MHVEAPKDYYPLYWVAYTCDKFSGFFANSFSYVNHSITQLSTFDAFLDIVWKRDGNAQNESSHGRPTRNIQCESVGRYREERAAYKRQDWLRDPFTRTRPYQMLWKVIAFLLYFYIIFRDITFIYIFHPSVFPAIIKKKYFWRLGCKKKKKVFFLMLWMQECSTLKEVSNFCCI